MIRPQRHAAAAHADAARRATAVGLGLDSADVRAAHGRAPAPRGRRQRARPRRLRRRAAPSLRRRRARDPGVRGHQPADRPRADDLEALGGRAHARAAVRRRARRRVRRSRRRPRDRHRLRLPGGAAVPASASASCRSSACKALHDKARGLLAPLRDSRLRLVFDDGMRGHPPGAPYDSIVAAAGGGAIPQAWLDQLAVGGRLVAPVQQGRRPGARRRRPPRRSASPMRSTRR